MTKARRKSEPTIEEPLRNCWPLSDWMHFLQFSSSSSKPGRAPGTQSITITQLIDGCLLAKPGRRDSYMGSVRGPRLTDCQESHQISQIRPDDELSQVSPKAIFDLTDWCLYVAHEGCLGGCSSNILLLHKDIYSFWRSDTFWAFWRSDAFWWPDAFFDQIPPSTPQARSSHVWTFAYLSHYRRVLGVKAAVGVWLAQEGTGLMTARTSSRKFTMTTQQLGQLLSSQMTTPLLPLRMNLSNSARFQQAAES